MSELLRATDTASRVGLVKALERAAAAGQTSTVETVLGALTERFPAGAAAAVLAAVNRAVFSRQWGTVAYLATYLADTAKPRKRGGGAKPFKDPATEHVEQEVLRCLRDYAEKTPASKPFRLTDAMEDECVGRGVGFALSVAMVDCAARGVPEADRFECARAAVGAPGDAAVAFQRVYPDLPPDAYGGAENPCHCFGLADSAWSARTLVGGSDPVVPPGLITLKLSEPPELAGRYTVETDGSRASLALAVATLYQGLYAQNRSLKRDLSELDLAAVVPAGPEKAYAVRLVPQE